MMKKSHTETSKKATGLVDSGIKNTTNASGVSPPCKNKKTVDAPPFNACKLKQHKNGIVPASPKRKKKFSPVRDRSDTNRKTEANVRERKRHQKMLFLEEFILPQAAIFVTSMLKEPVFSSCSKMKDALRSYGESYVPQSGILERTIFGSLGDDLREFSTKENVENATRAINNLAKITDTVDVDGLNEVIAKAKSFLNANNDASPLSFENLENLREGLSLFTKNMRQGADCLKKVDHLAERAEPLPDDAFRMLMQGQHAGYALGQTALGVHVGVQGFLLCLGISMLIAWARLGAEERPALPTFIIPLFFIAWGSFQLGLWHHIAVLIEKHFGSIIGSIMDFFTFGSKGAAESEKTYQAQMDVESIDDIAVSFITLLGLHGMKGKPLKGLKEFLKTKDTLSKSLADTFKKIVLGLEWAYNYAAEKAGFGGTVNFISSRSDDVQAFCTRVRSVLDDLHAGRFMFCEANFDEINTLLKDGQELLLAIKGTDRAQSC